MGRIGVVFVMVGLMTTAAVPALAGSSAGFDCAKAVSATEQTVCKTEALAWLDRQITRLYGELRGVPGKRGKAPLRNGQRAWLSARDACGADRDCIAKQYWKRLLALTFTFKSKPATGHFVFANAPNEGTLSVVEFSEGRAVARISTFVPRLGGCELDMTDMVMTEDGTAHQELDIPGHEQCKVEISTQFTHATVRSTGCDHFCRGAGLFHGEYVRR